MAVDYSKFSDADLAAIAEDDYSKMSDEGLKLLSEDTPEADAEAARIAKEQAPDTWGDVAGKTAAAVGTGMAIGKDIVSPVLNNPWVQKGATVGAELYGAKKLIADPILRALGGGAPAAAPTPVTTPATPTTFTGGVNPEWDAALSKPYSPVKNAIARTAATAGQIASQTALPYAAMLAPYAMAAHEQSKIRLNPNAPQYANNPYAQSLRSQGTNAPMTQGQAGAMNQRAALANMPVTGNAQERAILQADQAQRQQAMAQRQAQAKAVLQQPPTAQNFIERMRALSSLYSPL